LGQYTEDFARKINAACELLRLAENSLWRAKIALTDINSDWSSSIRKRISEMCSEIREISQRLKMMISK